MSSDSSGSPIDRVIAWLRGLLGAGKSATDTAARDVRRSTREATDTVRERADDTRASLRERADEARGTIRDDVDDAEQRVRDMTGRHRGDDRGRQGLPDLADEPSGGGRSTFGATAAGSAQDATPYRTDTGAFGEPDDEMIDQRSDFADAGGDWETGEETYPSDGDLDAATHVHDAIGGNDERADDATDGTIDATRDAGLRPGGTEGYQDREIPLQDQLIVDEGASSDEFDGDEVTPGDADNPYVSSADVAYAAEGYGDTDNTDLANTSAEGTSTLTGSTYTETDVNVPSSGTGGVDATASGAGHEAEPEDAGSFHVVERYNYGVGDLGVGAGTAPESAWEHDAGPDVTTGDIDSGIDADLNAGRRDVADADTGTSPGFEVQTFSTGAADQATAGPEAAPGGVDASVSSEATRTEIESESRGDAVNRSDEATQTPGFGEPQTFAETEVGTTEASRSATGNELEEEQDALGTTLDYEAESDAFSEEEANLSDETELTISDEDVDYGSADAASERVTTFQSGTIAHEQLGGEEAAIDEEVTAEAYADLPDEPEEATADDAGVDDFAGSDYPSDRRVDTLAGDDFTDAEVPDVPDLDSSAGDLDMPAVGTDDVTDYVEQPVTRTVGDAGGRIDQDMVGTSDEHVGGEEPGFAEMASRGTDETSVDDLSPAARAVDETLAAGGSVETGEAVEETFAASDFTGASDLGAGAEGTTDTEAAPELGGMGISDGTASDTASDASLGATGQASRAGGASAPAGAVRGDGGTDAPEGYPVKGNANSMIYHLPGFPSYRDTKAEFYFASEDDAIAAGYRAPTNVRRGGEAAAASAASAAAAVADDTGAVTGDETSHVAPGEVAFDERLSGDAGVDAAATSAATGSLFTEGDTEPRDAGSEADVPTGAVRGDGTTNTPDGYPVKGNASSKIYHLPSFPSYKSTKAEFCFATEQDAIAAGYRAPGKRNRGRRS